MLRGCSLEILSDMVTMAIEVVAFHHYSHIVVLESFLRAQWFFFFWAFFIFNFFKSPVSRQCPELSGWCQSQPMLPMVLPISQFVSSEEQSALTRPTCSPLADQAKTHWGWFWKVVRLTEKLSKSWKFSQVFFHKLCKKPQSVVDSTGSGCLCGVNQ